MTHCENVTAQADYLIILGCRVKGREPERTLIMRIESAAEYLLEHPRAVAVACGGIVHSDQDVSEAQAIHDGLVRLGVESERIVLENKSKTTVENFVNAKKIIEALEKGKDRKATLAFLSSDFHIQRASMIAKQCGIDAFAVSADSPPELLTKNKLREKAILLYLKKSQTHPHS